MQLSEVEYILEAVSNQGGTTCPVFVVIPHIFPGLVCIDEAMCDLLHNLENVACVNCMLRASGNFV